MGTKATPTKFDLPPLQRQRREPSLPGLEVYELHGEEADSQWAAEYINQYLDQDERSSAATAPSPLL